MATKRPYTPRFAVLVLCAAACSAGGKTSTPATTIASPEALAKLGPCPPRIATTSLTKLNTGIPGLDEKLVPIAVLNARICEYDSQYVTSSDMVPGPLIRSAFLHLAAARRLENAANQLQLGTYGALGCTGPGGGEDVFFLTFGNQAQQVVLEEPYGACGGGQVSNGATGAGPTSIWLDDLDAYLRASTAKDPVRP